MALATTLDRRYCYGFRCSWHGPIQEVGRIPGTNIPGCPHCGCGLFELPTAQEWWDGATEHEKTHPGYVKMLLWSAVQPKCWRTVALMEQAYVAAGSPQ